MPKRKREPRICGYYEEITTEKHYRIGFHMPKWLKRKQRPRCKECGR